MSFELVEDEPSQNMVSDLAQGAGRNVARQGSNLLTVGVGLPGDVFSLINEFIARPASKAITGKEGVPYEETYLGKVLPTTETHRKNIESQFGDYLKPKNKIEKFVDDVVEDTSLLFSPAKIIQKGFTKGSNFFKNLSKSIGANLAGETAKQNLGSDTAGTAAKSASLLLLSLLDQESAAKQVGKLYSQAESNLPKGAKESANVLTKQIDSLQHKITKGRPRENLSPPEKFVIDQADKIKNLIINGKIDIEQAIAQKRSLNKELSTLYKEVPKHSDQKTVKNMAKQLNGYLNEVIEIYGKKNPKFYGPYKNADQAFGTLAKSNFISHWIDQNVVQHPVTQGLFHLFAPAAKATAIAALPYQAAKLTYRIANSKTLAKIYGKTLNAAIKEDSVAFNKYLKELDQAVQEDENEDKFEFVD